MPSARMLIFFVKLPAGLNRPVKYVSKAVKSYPPEPVPIELLDSIWFQTMNGLIPATVLLPST